MKHNRKLEHVIKITLMILFIAIIFLLIFMHSIKIGRAPITGSLGISLFMKINKSKHLLNKTKLLRL